MLKKETCVIQSLGTESSIIVKSADLSSGLQEDEPQNEYTKIDATPTEETATHEPENDPEYTVAKVAEMSDAQVEEALSSLGQTPIPKPPAGGNDDEKDENGSTIGWKRELLTRLDRVRLLCGELCTLNTLEEIERHYDPSPTGTEDIPTVLVPNVSCANIMGMKEIDAGDMTFPSRVPEELQDFYTLSGALHFRWDRIRKDAYLGGESETKHWKTGSTWEETDINNAIKELGEGTMWGPYGVPEVNNLRDTLSKIDIKDKSVLVIGSSHPWVEIICLYLGAKLVTTLEYGTIDSHHPQIKTETPDTFREKYLAGKLESFDGVVTHSSLEHSGLGRYGDALNPWGDILGVARGWCATKPGGFLWLGVPTGNDMIFYNWHRVYGKHRWPLVAANWKQVGVGISTTPVGQKMGRGPFKSMANEGFIFRKVG